MAKIIIVYITMPSEEKAKEIARALLEKRLIACATMLPCKSMYRWNGSIQDDQELIMLVKTAEDRFDELEREVVNMHPYQIPCILKLEATAHIPYMQWVHSEVQS